MRDPEYDRFGPWAMEISDEDPPPPLFLPYLTRDEAPLLSIKIPRSIERRKAHAGMNLYDFLVCLFADDLVVLERVGDDARAETFCYRDIHCIQYSEELLKGNLRLHMKDQVYDLPFNTVSKDLMRRMVEMIRCRYADDDANMTIGEVSDAPHTDLSFLFTNLLANEKAQSPSLRLMVSQVDTPVGTFETGPVHKLVLGAIGKTLLESLHLCDGRELKIIDRCQSIKYRWQAVYGSRVTYFPLRKITGIDWTSDPHNVAIVNLAITTAGGSTSFALLADNPSIPSYDGFLHRTTSVT